MCIIYTSCTLKVIGKWVNFLFLFTFFIEHMYAQCTVYLFAIYVAHSWKIDIYGKWKNYEGKKTRL
jgi:hypothetical protein